MMNAMVKQLAEAGAKARLAELEAEAEGLRAFLQPKPKANGSALKAKPAKKKLSRKQRANLKKMWAGRKAKWAEWRAEREAAAQPAAETTTPAPAGVAGEEMPF